MGIRSGVTREVAGCRKGGNAPPGCQSVIDGVGEPREVSVEPGCARTTLAGPLDGLLEGADMTGFDYGYADVSGTIDTFTVVPPLAPEGGCILDGSRLTCRQ